MIDTKTQMLRVNQFKRDVESGEIFPNYILALLYGTTQEALEMFALYQIQELESGLDAVHSVAGVSVYDPDFANKILNQKDAETAIEIGAFEDAVKVVQS